MVRYELYSTGSNSHGQLGLDSDEDFSEFTRISLPSNTHPLKLAFGANHTLLLATVNGRRRLLGAGSNAAGQLGTGRKGSRFRFEELEWEEFVPREANISKEDYEVASVASTWETSIVHLRPREGKEREASFARTEFLVSFGSNDWGERGSGSADNGGGGSPQGPAVISLAHLVTGPIKVSQLVAGPRHVLATLRSLENDDADHLLVGWGAARHGQLGTLDRSSKLPKIVARPELVHLPLPFRAQEVLDIDCGKDHTVISLLQSHERAVVLLGSNKHGQLGLSRSNLQKSTEQPATNYHILQSSTLIGSSRPQTARTTWNSTFIAIPSSSSTSTSSSSEPSLISFGSNSHGQLGSQTPFLPSNYVSEDTSLSGGMRVVKLPTSSSDSPRLPEEAETEPPTFRSQLRLSTGSEHVLLVVESTPLLPLPSTSYPKNQELFAWGWNEHGNLGLGARDLADRREPVRVGGATKEKLDQGGRIENVWGGMATSWVLIRFEND
ncbi:hypothetical protein JCM5350_001116 [Sporobolomyces pararoseus]